MGFLGAHIKWKLVEPPVTIPQHEFTKTQSAFVIHGPNVPTEFF